MTTELLSHSVYKILGVSLGHVQDVLLSDSVQFQSCLIPDKPYNFMIIISSIMLPLKVDQSTKQTIHKLIHKLTNHIYGYSLPKSKVIQ